MFNHSLNFQGGVRALSLNVLKRHLLSSSLLALLTLFALPAMFAQISFDFSTLNFQGQGSINASTSLQFGPDGKLYVSERYGNIKVFTIQRNGPGNYVVTSSQTISLVQSIPNHNDDGGNSGTNNRQVTGLTVTGTASNPVVYVSSSDPRIGGGGSGGDTNLDTNSGIITRLTKNGNSWEAVDIVRGLPRSEENHATNGMEYTVVNGTKYLIVCSGGFTNAGAPSNNFAYIGEYALSAAILSINISQLESMGINTDGSSGRKYIYDIPTLDDPTRSNQNGITDPDTPGYNGKDNGDPFGGNDGLNMAMLVPGGPVQIFSPGYRNSYDLALTASGAVYVTDNGANGGWGGYPQNEASPNVNNSYRNGEPGSTSSDGNEPPVNNKDHLQLITTNINNYNFGSYYGGHPNPVRANTNAGLYTLGNHSSGGAYFRTVPYDPSSGGAAGNPNQALPANWPPVPSSMINTVNADFRNPGDNNPDGQNDNPVTTWSNNTNGIDEYTASNFGGAMKGNLIAGVSGGALHRVILQSNGQLASLEQNKFSTQGGNPLGITCQGDNDVFPGSIWVGTFDGRIVVLEPADAVSCIQPGQPGYDPNADYDSDGFTNQDEIDNGTDHCSGASQPNDFDNDSVSDLNDLDDDGDGINDQNDPFQLGQPFDFPVTNELFSDNLTLGGYLGLGLTGLMNNEAANPNYLNWLDDPNDPNSPINDIYGGAIGAVTIYQTAGDAFSNNQEKAFQYGVKVDQGTGNFVIKSKMMPPFHNHIGNESQGIFMGTGFQNNYIKLVLGSNGLKVQGENGGTQLNGLPSGSIPTPSSELILMFAVDPAASTVQAKYSVNGGPVNNLGAPFAVNGAVKTAIQQSNTPLAVGLIGTNAGNGEFAANWDYLNVEPDSDNPYVTQTLPNISRALGAPSDNINLNQYFDDNNGHANLTYTVQQNTNPSIGANINGNTLTLSYPGNPASSTITIRATDQGNLFVEQSFTVSVQDQPAGVLYRVNSGGPAITAIDGGLSWGEDSDVNNSQYLSNPGSNSVNGFGMAGYDPSVNQATTPVSIFDTERWEQAGGAEMQYSFPVSQPGDYEVRLYVGNGYTGTQAPGSRIYSVEVEGSVPAIYQNIDLSNTFGHQIGGMLSFIVTVNDGSLDLVFLHNVENPLVNGIEIIGGGGGSSSQPIVLSPIAPVTNQEGDNANVTVTASGGDGNLVYSASNLPPGVSIDPTNGLIGGTIQAGASNNSPYTVVVTVDDSDTDNSDIKTTSFIWTVTAPGTGSATVYLEAECGTVGSNWSTQNDGSSSGGEYLLPPAGVSYNTPPTSSANIVSFSFNLSSTGQYNVFARVKTPTSNDDSFWVRANGGTWIKWNEIQGSTNWIWDRVHNSDNGNQLVSFNMNSGTNTLEFGWREDGTGLDKILVTQSTATPSGLGGSAGNCSGQTPINLSSVQNQSHQEGQTVNLAIQASGGDGALVYSANGLPAGLNINAGTGLISGTIAANAANNSPYSVTVTVDDSDADNSDAQTTAFTWTVTTPGTGSATVYLEAECGTVGSNWSTQNDGSSSGGEYLLPPGGVSYNTPPTSAANIVSFSFNLSSAGQYNVFARVKTPSSNDDSFWVRANGGTWIKWNEIQGSANWIWDRVHNSDNGNQLVSFNMNSGNNTLDFGWREDGTGLDKILVTQSTATPSGLGGAAGNCSGQNPINLSSVQNQSHQEGQSVNLAIQASGGDGALVYSANGLPAGLNINASTGLISGTIAANAANNSPYSVTVTVDDSDAGNTDAQTTNFTWTVNAPGTGVTEVYLEAECGTVGSNWSTQNDGSSSGGEYLLPPGGVSYNTPPTTSANIVSFSFNLSNAGQYNIFARVKAPTGDDDSFWVRANGGTWIKWNQIQGSANWIWDQVHNADNGNQLVSFSMNSGTNTVEFGWREDGTGLDKIFVTQSTVTPSGLAGAANNCSGQSALHSDPFQQNLEDSNSNPAISEFENMGIAVYPNPANATDKLNIEFTQKIPRTFSYTLFDLQGRKVMDETLIEMMAGDRKVEVDIQLLPSGLYLLIIEGDEFRSIRRLQLRRF